MCLIVIAHKVSPRFPLVIAANRDEDYDRASHDAHFWTDAPDILGGRDAVAGGSWLAVTKSGRFAAVTNLRGAEVRTRSRGALVRDFVVSGQAPESFAETVVAEAEQYSGFHLFVGEAGGDIVYVTPQSRTTLSSGVYAVSNAPEGEIWPKTDAARREMEVAMQMDDPSSLMLVLLQFLAAPRGTNAVESEVFIAGERYGTRASTVIVATPDEILFGEQSFARGGEAYGRNRLFRVDKSTGRRVDES
jgi:uncharacterized protein with NRDE domain